VSYQLWADTHRKWVALGVAGAAIAGVVATKRAA
jgi:hypothetical protein